MTVRLPPAPTPPATSSDRWQPDGALSARIPVGSDRRAARRRTSTGRLRLTCLDGLRGTAAAVVVLHHLSMTLPAVSRGYDQASALRPFSLAWWLVATPVKLVVAGPEFVLVFFALSGFVLAIAPLSAHDGDTAHPYDWVAYFPRRILRIGLPAAASMVLAYGVITVLPHPLSPDASSWTARQARPDLGWRELVTQSLLIVNTHRPGVNPPMWSLTWEMWFSLILPLVVVLVLWWRRRPSVWMPVLVGVSIVGYVFHRDGAMFLPAFVLGALLGSNAGRIQAFLQSHRAQRRVRVGAIAVAAGAPLLMIGYWLLRTVAPLDHTETAVALAMRVPGAVMLVAVVAFWAPARRLFEHRALVALGTVSFSLYLVHSPVLVVLGLTVVEPWWPLAALGTLVVVAGLTVVMYRLVERPSVRLAAMTGRGMSRVVRRAGLRALATLRG